MSEKRNMVLVVDDHELNRNLLIRILSKEYDVIEAENGREAFELVSKNPSVSVILLDLVMPVMNGYEFLDKIKDSRYASIPIIVMTAETGEHNEEKALDLGAIDYIEKPINPKILVSRVHNAILRNQIILLDKLKFLSTHDALTGLYNRNKMFAETRRMLQEHADEKFVFIRYDIDRFRLYNSTMGEEEGNNLLRYIGDKFKEIGSLFEYATYGRVDADVFCICEPYDMEKMEKQMQMAEKIRNEYRDDYVIDSTFGIYLISDIEENVEVMFTKASMASEKCKSISGVNIAFYEESMEANIIHERWIVKEMKKALEQEQFKVYLQPKYSLKSNVLRGAEALVRWVSPEAGMISPGKFIPIFEKNGFVASLDFYMWEKVCMLMNRWKSEGRVINPVSVNVSRISLYNPHIADILKNLIKKYDIEPELLNLEVTESAYMSNPDLMKSTIGKLQSEGFVILMDDFGSGYSSLNTLKEIKVDVLKVDMKFLPDDKNDVRSEKILSSIIRMAGWLDMPVIAEGVETYEQKEFLESIGCGYVQGYYYAKPMPVSDYERLMESNVCLPEAPTSDLHKEKIDAVWSSNPQVDEILKTISLPVMIMESSSEMTEIVRTNKAYLNEFDIDISEKIYGILDLEDDQKAKDAFRRAKLERSVAECEIKFVALSGVSRWFRLKIQLISQIEKSDMYCIIFVDITQEKEYEKRLLDISNYFRIDEDKKKMLVIDDQEVNRGILKALFCDNYDILEAKNGIEGLKLLKEYSEEIVIVLLDMIMPEMGGEDFLKKKINMSKRIKDIPVVVVSSESTANTQLSMLKLGVNDYIIKPYEPEITKQKVKNAIERHRQLIGGLLDNL